MSLVNYKSVFSIIELFKYTKITLQILFKFSLVSFFSILMIFFSFKFMISVLVNLMSAQHMLFFDKFVTLLIIFSLIFIYLFGYILSEYSVLFLKRHFLSLGTQQKTNFYQDYLKYDYGFYSKSSLQKHFFAITTFNDSVQDAVQSFLGIIPVFIRFVAYFSIMLWISVWLALLALVLSFISEPLAHFLVKFLYSVDIEENLAIKTQNEFLNRERLEMLVSNVPLIQYSGGRYEEHFEFLKKDESLISFESNNILTSGLSTIIHFIKNALVVSFIRFSNLIGKVAHGGVFFYALFGLEKVVNELANIRKIIIKAKILVDDIERLLKKRCFYKVLNGNEKFLDIKYSIEFKNVIFNFKNSEENDSLEKVPSVKILNKFFSLFNKYIVKKNTKICQLPIQKKVVLPFGKTHPIINSLTVVFPAGKFSAVLGETGVGKTTLLYLIMRLYNYDQGVIFIDGNDIRNFDLSSYYSNIGFIAQNPQVLNRSLKENLTYGIRKKVSNERVLMLLEELGLKTFFDNLPKGLNTKIGYGGVFVSDGEMQRIAIARLILAEPKIALLDESTSALDLDTEKKVMKVLKTELKGKTVIFVTHRKSILDYVDHVFIMEKGRIASCDNVLDNRMVA